MSLIWRPDDPDRAQPKVIVNRGAERPQPAQSRSLGYEETTSKPPAGVRYGVVDTTFSTVDMGAVAVEALRGQGIPEARILRRTVPGFKDLAVAAKRMVERDGCAIVVACGMVGPEPIDKQCGHEASMAIAQAQLMTSTHVLEVFVHMDEAKSDAELIEVARNRTAEHAVNAVWLVERPHELVARAGTGQRQGFQDAGPADPRRGDGSHLRPGKA
ncbi:MAG: riboflavin synthase [Thermoplasmata archaeon]|jgi:riboflavin synthase|nr:riboflavin synthase [Thermoplasmata archaeon]